MGFIKKALNSTDLSLPETTSPRCKVQATGKISKGCNAEAVAYKPVPEELSVGTPAQGRLHCSRRF